MVIVVGIDYSELSARALTLALTHARASGPTIVRAVTIVDFPPRAPEALVEEARDTFRIEAEKTLSAYLAPYGQDLPEAITLVADVRFGHAGEELVAVAVEYQADLVAVGSHGREPLERLLLGSISEYVMHHARCAILIAR